MSTDHKLYRKTLRVLVVDDDENDYLLTRELLTNNAEMKFVVDWGATCEEARQELALQRHDVYLIDYRLGPVSGLDLIREAVGNGCSAPLILLTGQGDRAVDAEAMQSGAADYLSKNQISAPLLDAAIRHSLDRSKTLEQLRRSEERYRLLFERNLSGVHRTTLDGEVLDCNESFARMFGYASPAAVMNEGDRDLYIHPKDREAFINKLLRLRSVANFEMRMSRQDGTLVWTLTNACLIEPKDDMPAVIEGTLIDITDRKAAEEQLRALSARLESVREEERTRIARELHDELGQALTALKFDVSWLGRRVPDSDPALATKVGSMLKFIDQTIDSVRRLSAELRPSILDHFGLTATVEWELKEFQHRTGLVCRFLAAPEPFELDSERSTALFRILQEALTNVSRHANATEVMVELQLNGHSVSLNIEDNGRGITESEVNNPRSLGILGIRERARILGGAVDIRANKPEGTCVEVSLPLGHAETT